MAAGQRLAGYAVEEQPKLSVPRPPQDDARPAAQQGLETVFLLELSPRRDIVRLACATRHVCRSRFDNLATAFGIDAQCIDFGK